VRAGQDPAVRIVNHGLATLGDWLRDWVNREPVDAAELHARLVDYAREVLNEFEQDIRREERDLHAD
jgi:hypothetical protein